MRLIYAHTNACDQDGEVWYFTMPHEDYLSFMLKVASSNSDVNY